MESIFKDSKTIIHMVKKSFASSKPHFLCQTTFKLRCVILTMKFHHESVWEATNLLPVRDKIMKVL